MALSKTAAGQQALKERSATLLPRQRCAFILFDGQRSTSGVLEATRGLGTTPQDIAHLLALGLLAELAPATSVPGPEAAAPDLSNAERFSQAYGLATQLAGSLGLRGYRLTLAVEAAADCAQLRLLVPRLQEAVGAGRCGDLERVLRH
ncbi:MAG TPA: hypothetical protein VLJ58_04740 [Ramlibacter sp.]|nr:hypothetical protein [Ramlibacter sp.]